MGKPQSKSPGSARAGSSSAEAKTAKKAAAPRPKKAAKEGAKKKAQDDVVLVHGRDENGGLHVLRKKGEELSAGVLEPLQHGKPVRGDILKLKPREDAPFLADVVEEVAIGGGITKPAKVSTPKYKKGWDAIWGARAKAKREDDGEKTLH